MNSDTRTIVLLSGICVLLLVIGVFLLVFDRGVETTPVGGSLDTEIPPTVGQQDIVPLGVSVLQRDGSKTVVRDFSQDSDVTNWYGDESVLLLGEDTVDGDPLYQIFYYEIDNSIGVSLLQAPLGFARARAEADLLEKLGVSDDEACQMAVLVNTPSFVDQNLSGKNFGLSFCPGSVALENT